MSFFNFNKLNAIFQIGFLLIFTCFTAPLFAAEGYSEINNALFDSPHMKNIRTSGTLEYIFESITQSESFEDTVRIDISNIKEDGHNDQSYSFFTGNKKRNYPSRKNIIGNGIFMYFLERDVHNLERKTGGSWRHFQRRIRWAMAAGAKKELIDVTFQGKKIKAIQYTIQPYSHDKEKKRYGSYVNKYYRFILSKDIPGMIYKIHTFVPKTESWKEGDELLENESMTFKSFHPNIKHANQH